MVEMASRDVSLQGSETLFQEARESWRGGGHRGSSVFTLESNLFYFFNLTTSMHYVVYTTRPSLVEVVVLSSERKTSGSRSTTQPSIAGYRCVIPAKSQLKGIGYRVLHTYRLSLQTDLILTKNYRV